MVRRVSAGALLSACALAAVVACCAAAATERRAGAARPLRAARSRTAASVAAARVRVVTAACPDPADCTAHVQAALDADAADVVVVPAAEVPWQVGPLFIRRGRRTVLEPGAELLAIEGGFQGTSDCLLTIEASARNVTINATGATLRMRKLDYVPPRYARGEWRMLLSVRGAVGLSVFGGTWADAGGDGMYVGDDPGSGASASRAVLIRGVVVTGAWRNGLSVISAVGLRVEDSQFSYTNGTNPQCGVDLEPDTPAHRLQGVAFRNVTLAGNSRCGFSMGPYALAQSGAPVDVTVAGMRITGTAGSASSAGLPPLADRGGVGIVLSDSYNLTGRVTMADVTVAATFAEAVYLSNWPSGALATTFANLSIWNASYGGSAAVTPRGFGPVAPIVILPTGGTGKDENASLPAGGVHFESAAVHDGVARPWLSCMWDGTHGHPAPPSLANVTGDVAVFNPLAAPGCPADFGGHPSGVTVRVACNPPPVLG